MQTQLNFFNTINLPPVQVAEEVINCNKQEQRILDIMKSGQPMTPFEVWDMYNAIYPATVTTSIRRAMTVLTNKGYLIMHSEMRMERYGKPNHLWSKK